MPDIDDPKWGGANDPQQWETYWRACYQIVGSEGVIVEEYCRSEKAATEVARDALAAALEEIAKHGIKVEASCWAVKHQSRRQHRNFPATNTETYVTAKWCGNFTVVLKSLAESEASR